jgi:DNA invertase Pin-like site-specific DNA recombinase
VTISPRSRDHLEDCGGSGGIYCRVPHADDADQTPVDTQENLCRQRAANLSVSVSARSVYLDTHRSAWKRDGNRAGWSALQSAVKIREFASLVLYRPGSLFRYRPQDGIELLEMCDEHGVRLHGLGDEWDLGDPGQRHALLERAIRARQAAESASHVASSQHRRASRSGQPHGGGRRAYGYSEGMRGLIPAEAEIVREVFSRYLAGEALRAIAGDLNVRGVPTATGGAWSTGGIARLIDAPRYAGLRVFRGQIALNSDGDYQHGAWERCVSVEDWERAHELRTACSPSTSDDSPTRHQYALTGLIVCDDCGGNMVGTIVGSYRMYACSSTSKVVAGRCSRHIGAASLEEYVEGTAIRVLEDWDARRMPELPMAVRRDPAAAKPSAPTSFSATHGAVKVRSADALDGVGTGVYARRSWSGLSSSHKTAVLRFLFESIRIGPKTTSRGVFDESRITVVRNEL